MLGLETGGMALCTSAVNRAGLAAERHCSKQRSAYRRVRVHSKS